MSARSSIRPMAPVRVLLVVLMILVGFGVAGADSPDPRGADVAYIATGTNFPDALGAGPAAALGSGPILLVQTDSVPSQTTTELNRLEPRLIVIVGGTAAVSTTVENTLKGLSFGPTVIRVSGSNRYATAAAISQQAFPCAEGEVMAGRDRQGVVCRPELSGNWSTQEVDSTGTVGAYTSIALDAFGNPVISYHDSTNTSLKLAHCDDPACSGGGESIVTVDNTANLGYYTSLALDSSGYPVIAYYDATNTSLKLAHCNDPNCSSGGESIVTVDNTANLGWYTSLVLDSSGNPVIAYHDVTSASLKLAHCDDANCSGGGESIVTVDNTADVGYTPSLVLDAAGNPVISYYDSSNSSLKLAHCNDANCSSGGDSLVTVDNDAELGRYTSLVLDSTGYPVISYYDNANTSLKLAHCNDANCSSGGDSIVTVDNTADVGWYTSLVLDSAGNPVISYYDLTNSALKVAQCDDANCSGGGESIVTVDNTATVGWDSSLVLDPAGNPVVSYYDATNGDLNVTSF
ncbi:MAG: cell wall-binding repeat-containing protein [Acidimicrobiia bacterium]|nr:MAG: cell wall-binding repeat-containing protein [Acidimicrobiia bacterium]